MKNYWDVMADQFHHQQPPLRPGPRDIQIMRRLTHEWSLHHSRPRTNVLLFGVTPEIATLPWPPGTHLLAVEKSQAMIDVVWPGDIREQRQVIRRNWFDLEMEDRSFDIIIGDGFLTALAYPDDYSRIARSVSRWLRTDGLLILRAFARPEKKETLEEIALDLAANRISRFDILKWRLAMALQKTVQEGVIVDDIYRAWLRLEARFPALVERAGWPRATVNTIRLYAGRTNAYSFPTVNELTQAFARFLEPVSLTVPEYDFGERCPILACRVPVASGAV